MTHHPFSLFIPISHYISSTRNWTANFELQKLRLETLSHFVDMTACELSSSISVKCRFSFSRLKWKDVGRGGVIPCEFIAQEVTAHFHGPEDVVADLLQELTVLGEGLWVRVAAFVRTELQHNYTERQRVGRESSRRKLTDVKRLETSSNYICEAIFAKQSIVRLPVIISACFQETFTVNYHLMERHHVISATAVRGCNIDRFVCTSLHLAACVHTDTHMQRGAHAHAHTRANKLEKKYLSLTLKLEPFSIRSAQTHTSTPSPHISCSSINLNHMRKSNPPTATKHTQTRVCLVAMNHVTPQLCPLSVKRFSKESHKGWYKWHHTVRAGNENRIS